MTAFNDQQAEIVPMLQALSDGAKAELHRQVKSTADAYAAPVRTTEQQRLVDEHEQYKKGE